MFKFMQEIRARRAEERRIDTTRAINSICEKVEERLDMIRKGIRGNSSISIHVGKSEVETVLRTVRNVMQRSENIPAWTSVTVSERNGYYCVRIACI